MAEKKKEKHLVVSEDTHKRAKLQALQSNQTIDAYISQCLAQCKASKKSS